MRVACAGEWIDERSMGLLVSIIATWQRNLAREAKQSARAATPKGYLAAEGDKITDVAVVITGVHETESCFGYHPSTTTIVMMTAVDTGHELTWFATGTKDNEIGDHLTTARATVST